MNTDFLKLSELNKLHGTSVVQEEAKAILDAQEAEWDYKFVKKTGELRINKYAFIRILHELDCPEWSSAFSSTVGENLEEINRILKLNLSK